MNHTFELNVDEWKFVGHPFSVQSKSFDIKFNIAFIVEVFTLLPIHIQYSSIIIIII